MEEQSPQETPAFTVKKKVDESWKNTVEKEKSAAGSVKPEAPASEPPSGKVDFLYFVSTLGMQALAAMGEVPDDTGVAGPADLGQAQQLIDVLEMLALKTKGNISAQEKASFDEMLYQLRLKFVQKSQGL